MNDTTLYVATRTVKAALLVRSRRSVSGTKGVAAYR
jgi:hypothetical protein